MGPKPKATSDESANAPVTFPATVNTATFLPQAIARAMTNKTLGPGAKIITIAAMMYSTNRLGMTIV
jgi:hypothetical protein